jgi:triacylglycerol lipase
MRTCLLLPWILIFACATEPVEPELTKDQAAADAETRPEDGKADGFDVCSLAGWYGDGVCDRFCARFDSDCPLIGATPSGAHTKYPIVLHHGLAGGRAWILTYNGIREALQADGHTVVQTQVPPFDSVEVRAAALAQQIDDTLRATGATKVNLIAHAMGGLDARYLISTLGYGDKIATLTTMSTPHRGAALADFALSLGVSDPLLNALALVIGAKVSDVGGDPHLRAAMQAMAEATAESFNAANTDDARVVYQSYAGVSSVAGSPSDRARVAATCENKLLVQPNTFDKERLEFIPFAGIVGHGGSEPHDGMVTVNSAKWGTFLGCVPGDHSDEIGQMTSARPNPRTSWDPQRFWRNVAFDLAARGF